MYSKKNLSVFIAYEESKASATLGINEHEHLFILPFLRFSIGRKTHTTIKARVITIIYSRIIRTEGNLFFIYYFQLTNSVDYFTPSFVRTKLKYEHGNFKVENFSFPTFKSRSYQEELHTSIFFNNI